MANRRKSPAENSDFYVVGIGASAGGITALRSLLPAFPAKPNLALVVIQHLMPGQPSQLVDVLASWSKMPVRQAADGASLERDCVYVAAPDDVLTIEQGIFRTRPLEGGKRRPGIDTIDAFLESLAVDRREKAIAVILSGTGNDGAAGAIRVRQEGGLVFAQDPITAMHDGMPVAVIARGVTDHVGSVGELARQVMSCGSGSYSQPASDPSWTNETSQTLDQIVGLIRREAGFDLSGYKATPLLWRIQQRMDIRRAGTFQDYEALLRDDPAELEALVRGIPIHVTEFFRDPEAWEVLSHDALKTLIAQRLDWTIRAWSPACATGEEAYSVAMLLSEHLESSKRPLDFQVFATDASPEILTRASRGVYSEKALSSVPPKRQTRFFYAADGAWRVKRSLREKMVFAPQDLLADPPFSGLDLVTCRNLLIYLDPEAVKRALFLLHSSLAMGGYLFLGRAEALAPQQRGFEPVSTRWNIYRKNGPLTGIKVAFPKGPAHLRHATAVAGSAHRAAIVHFDLPSVLIDEEFRILRIYGDTKEVLRLPPGEPTHNLLELVDRSAGQDLKLAAQDALADHHPITVAGLNSGDGSGVSVSMRLTPLQTAEHGGSPRLLVSFIRPEDRASSAQYGNGGRNFELPEPREWSEAVRISQQELEASREELQALNQELRASNEQLNISNEDLNEANARLQAKIAELEMQSKVLSSGGVMTLFLDPELRVRWFTAAVSELFPLIPGDIGRRITDFVQGFDDETFIADVRAVMQTGEPREREVRSHHDRWYLRGIRPHHSSGEATAGVAVTFADITAQKEAESVLRESEARFRALVHASSDVLYQMSPDWTEMRHLSGGGFLEDAGDPERNWLDRYIPPDDQPQVTAAIHEAMGAKRVFDIEHRVRMVDGTIGWTSSRAVPLYGETGEVKGWFGAASNITPLRESQNWLAAQKEAFQAAVSGASLEASLAILVRAATGQMGGGTRCAFYLADDSGAELHHVAGMPEAYSRCVDGFKIGPDSLACGLAVYTGKPVITVDVTEDPAWKQWLWLSQDFKFRGCWSFPIETSGGRVVGTFAVYHEEPRAAEARDLRFAAEMTGAAAIIISRHQETEERARLTRELLQAQEEHDREEVRR